MSPAALTILHVNTFDRWGGAEAIVRSLVSTSRERGHAAYVAVGRAVTDDPAVLPLESGGGLWRRACFGLSRSLRWLDRFAAGEPERRKSGLRTLVERAGQPGRVADEWRGIESFRFPGTYRLLGLSPARPDIVHAHNLHGGYFDLRALPWISQRAPIVLTLHDSWLTTGHCSHPFGCERWRTGCGHCPDLTIYPAIRRDATAANWSRKRAIYEASRVYVATPSRWLHDRVRASMLEPAIVESRVIANGIDLDVFRPGDKLEARKRLAIPEDARVLLFAGSSITDSPFKAFDLLRTAVSDAAAQIDRKLVLIALGQSRSNEAAGAAEIRFEPFEPEAEQVARYYQAADLYAHAARADTFPTTVLEAQACGTPVVATATGGIPEQVVCLAETDDCSLATGRLVPGGEPGALTAAIVALLKEPDLLAQLSRNAARHARERFDRERQTDAYLEWYREILGNEGRRACRA